MTKPKIANGNCLNPLSRLEKRFEEYKRCHQVSSKNCNKVQEAHNKSSDALKVLLERKSKLSDNKAKKKRSTATTAINRKKPKLSQDQLLQSNSGFFDNRVEATPNVTLNVHTSEIPDIDWDSFDILNNPNFSMSINEQELDGVLNSCYTQTAQITDTKTTQNTSELNLINVCKTSPDSNNDNLFIQNSSTSFTNKETVFPPLFPPPENPSLPCQSQQSVKFEYLSPQTYLSSTSCNYNPSANVVQPSTNQIDSQTAVFNSHSALYPMNLTAVNSANNLSYQYHNPLISEQVPGNSTQYFYQYPNYEDHLSGNASAESFQLPAMSTGWYNNGSGQAMKPANYKQPIVQQQQQQQQFSNTSITVGNYRNNYGQYHPIGAHQDNTQLQYQTTQQMFTSNHSQPYECPSQATIANYTMLPDQQHQQQYYYVDYHQSNGNRTVGNTNPPTTNNFINTNHNNNTNRSIISQNDPRFIGHPTNQVLCRNIYQ